MPGRTITMKDDRNMPVDPKIAALIEKALAAGVPQESLVAVLTARGWPEKEIYNALADHYEHLTGVEIPRRAGGGAGAKDAFFYLLIFSTLATWTLSVGWLAFTLIDHWLPDALFSAYQQTLDTYTVSSSLAAILVAFPLFLLISRAVAVEAGKHPEKLDSPIRKWLTYLALVIAACVFMGDLIAALTYLLRGELTSRFLAKAFVVLVLSGGVFFYYFGGMRKTDEPAPSAGRDRFMALLASAVVILVIALGFFELGAPHRQREMRADGERVRGLYQLGDEIDNYWTSHTSQLPPSLEKLSGARFSDPVTHAAYEYIPGQGSQYQLCATFTQPSNGGNEPGTAGADPWVHPSGHHCFQLDATVRPQYPASSMPY